ncbi:MAG: hypothetical protein ABI414_12745 [Devosia sp.]
MSIVSNLIATYSNTIQGMTRTLVIDHQDDTTRTISGSWASSINGVAASFPVSGIFRPAPGGNVNALFLVLSGAAEIPSGVANPPTMRALNAVLAYAEIQNPGLVDRLFITIAWAEDNPGYAKSTSAWTPLYLDRH